MFALSRNRNATTALYYPVVSQPYLLKREVNGDIVVLQLDHLNFCIDRLYSRHQRSHLTDRAKFFNDAMSISRLDLRKLDSRTEGRLKCACKVSHHEGYINV